MNATTATPPSTTTLSAAGILTTFNLALIALFAAVVVIGILYGMRLSRRRHEATQEVEDHAREAGVPPLAAAEEAPPADPAATVAPTPEPALPAPPPAPPSSAIGTAADGPVTQLKGVGAKVATRLAELGITTIGQLASLDEDSAAALDEKLGPFAGRLARDRWVEQARFLAAGDRAGFEAVFGRL